VLASKLIGLKYLAKQADNVLSVTDDKTRSK